MRCYDVDACLPCCASCGLLGAFAGAAAGECSISARFHLLCVLQAALVRSTRRCGWENLTGICIAFTSKLGSTASMRAETGPRFKICHNAKIRTLQGATTKCDTEVKLSEATKFHHARRRGLCCIHGLKQMWSRQRPCSLSKEDLHHETQRRSSSDGFDYKRPIYTHM